MTRKEADAAVRDVEERIAELIDDAESLELDLQDAPCSQDEAALMSQAIAGLEVARTRLTDLRESIKDWS